ncbi:MAG: GTP 3',8-cyclase MoaA [Acidobacteriaceae bacterium]|nr:GTP 3',8-cyclase MoaA [Acidobacteriaceae bacterium]
MTPSTSLAAPLQEEAPTGSEALLRDSYGRAITDLRLSVTDRCNYRCVYCRTGNTGAAYGELPLETYARILRLFVSLGVEKIRFTGGEPLLRQGLPQLIREARRLKPAFVPGGQLDLALTTNGHLLAEKARELRASGLDRVTVSMDAVEPEVFARITRVPNSFERVRDGIRAAQDAGFERIKVNCVLMRGFNDDQIEAFAEFSRTEDVIVRFIEFMPLEEADDSNGTGRRWSPETVIPFTEIVERLNRIRPLKPLAPNHLSETARRFTFDDGLGEIGIIAPVSQPFCGHCSRIRLTSDGKLRTCLFSHFDHDLAGRMTKDVSDSELTTWIRSVVDRKEKRHHIGEPGFLKPGRAMVHIGG